MSVRTRAAVRYTRTTLAEKTIRCKPWSSGTLLDILAKSDINGIVVFGYIAVDVVKSTVADLHVDVATEYKLQKPHKGGHDFFRASGQHGYIYPKHTIQAAKCQ